MTSREHEDRAPRRPDDAGSTGERPAPVPIPARKHWRAVLEALLPEDAEILARLAARGHGPD